MQVTVKLHKNIKLFLIPFIIINHNLVNLFTFRYFLAYLLRVSVQS